MTSASGAGNQLAQGFKQRHVTMLSIEIGRAHV